MAESNNRVRIDFDVNADELKEITQAINILDKFNKQASQVTNALGSLTGSMNNNNKATKAQKDGYINLDKAMNAWANRLKTNQSTMSSYEASQAKLTEKLKAYGRDVKVSVDETGKLSASFKNAEGNVVSLSGKYDKMSNSIKDMKTQLSTSSNELKKKAEADKKAAQEMDRLHAAAIKVNKGLDDQKKKYAELTRGTDISRVVRTNAKAFDVMNHAVKTNAEILRGSMDRNGKWSQTLRTMDNRLVTVSGYYDRATKKLIQYNEAVSKTEGVTKRASNATTGFQRDMTNLEKSMQGLNKYTMTWADAIEIAGTRMLQWNVAGTIIFGLQRGFQDMVKILFEIDSQMTQLFRVLPEETNFNEMWEDSIRLSTMYGRTLTDINEGLITFARSGFNNVDTRFLTEAATLMANVSDIDINDASETLTSALTLFNVKARDSIQVVNKLNEVDNDYAISTDQLAKSITRAGGTAASFGVDLNELIGHTTAIGVATRESGQIIGNSLKSIYSRVNTLGKAQKAIEELGIAMTLPNGDNRDVADIMNDVAKKWPELNNAQKQNTAINVAGTYQLNRFLALMNNYQMGLDATKTAQNSYNSAVKENEKFMKSLAARLNLMKSAFQQLVMALGEAGLYKVIILVLEAMTNLGQGLTKVVDTLGAFTFAVPLAAGALALFIAQYQKSRLEMVAFQATMLGMNTSLSRQALMMTTTATTTSILGTAFATLRTAAIGLTAALLTNPLTWIAVALTAIPMLIGHFQRLKAEQEALYKKAEDNTKAFKDFKAEVAKGDVSQTSMDTFIAKADVANKTLEKLEKGQRKYKESQEATKQAMTNMNVEYGYTGTAMQNYSNWQDTLSKKTKEELADIGIKYDKYNSYKELMKAVKDRQAEYTDTVSKGDEILKESQKQLMFNAEAFESVGEEVKEAMDIMELFFGVNDKMTQELIGSYNTIMVLSKVKEKDAAQTQAMEQAYSVWEERLGLTREELLKNPAAMKENIDWQMKMKDKWGEATGKVLDSEQQKQLAIDITKNKTKEAAESAIADEKRAAEEKAKAAEEEAKRKGKAFAEFRRNMELNQQLNLGMTTKEVQNATLRGDFNEKSAGRSIVAWQGENRQVESNKTAYEKFKDLQNAANKSREQGTSKAKTKITSELGVERKSAADTRTAYEKMKDLQNQANTSRTTKQGKSTSDIKANLKGERESAASTAKGHSDAATKVSNAAKNKKENVIKNAKVQNAEHKRQSADETKSVGSGWDKMWGIIDKIMGWIKGLFGIKSSSKKKGSSGVTRSYAKGTTGAGHPVDGMAIVSEKGRELIHDPKVGTYLSGSNGPEMRYLSKGTSVLPNHKTEKLLKSQGMPAYAGGVGDFFDALTKGPKAVWESGMEKFGLKDSLLPEWFNNQAGSSTKYITSLAVDKVGNMLESAMGSFGGGNAPNITGGASAWKTMIVAAARKMGETLSSSELAGIIAQIQRESGGNQKITQSSAVNDINMRNNNPARGLLQYIPQSFRAYSMPGFNNIYSGFDQLLAFFNNKNWRRDLPYGRSGWGPSGARKYANGGMIDKPHLGLVGEAGPEAIIPLSANRRSRALDLYEQTGKALGVRAYASGGIVGGKYKVKSGDTLSELAVQFKTTVKAIMSMNKSIKDADKIYKGQVLNMKKSTSTSGKPSTYYDGPSLKKTFKVGSRGSDVKEIQKILGTTADGIFGKNTLAKLKAWQKKNKLKVDGIVNSDDLRKMFTKSTAKKPKYTMAQADAKFQSTNDYVGYMQGMNAKGYDTAGYKTWKLRSIEGSMKYASADSKKDYNKQMAQALSEYGSVKDAKTRFNQAEWYGLSKQQKAAVWKGIEEDVRANAIEKLNSATSEWLNKFNDGLTEASRKVTDWLSLAESMKDKQAELKKDAYVDKYVTAGMNKYGMIEKSTGADAIKERMDTIKSQVEDKLTDSATIKYQSDPKAFQKRIDQLNKEEKTLQAKINQVTADAKKRGLTSSQYADTLKPLKDKMKELEAEEKALKDATTSNNATLKANEAAVKTLGAEYEKLQKELAETEKQAQILDTIKEKVSAIFDWSSASMMTDKTDEFGNSVRDIEGSIRAVLDIQKAISDITADIYNNIDKTVEEMITSILTTELPDLGDLFGKETDYSGIATGVVGAIDTIKPAWNDTLSYMSGSIMEMFNGQNWSDTMKKWMDNMAIATEGLAPMFENLMVKFPEVIAKVMSELPNLVYTAMQNLTVGVFNTVIEVLNRLVSTVNQIVPAGNRINPFEQMKYATPTYTQNNETNTEQKVYQAGSPATNVTYIVQAGVAIGSESELREFAMLLKSMMDEEEGRSGS